MGPPRRSILAAPRPLGVRSRLLGLVLIPSLGLGALVAQHVVERQAAATGADSLAASVQTSTAHLEALIAASEERRISGVVTEAGRFGLTPDHVGDLLGIDVQEQLVAARERVDRSTVLGRLLDELGGQDALRSARAGIDGGDRTAQDLFATMYDRALAAWVVEVAHTDAMDTRIAATGELHQSFATLVDAAMLYRAASDEMGAVATIVVSGLRVEEEADPADLPVASARVTAAMEDLRAGADRHLRARVATLAYDPSFSDSLRHLPAAATPGTSFDLDAIGAVFRNGIRRDRAIRAVVETAAADARTHALAAGAEARGDYHRAVAVLVAVVAASLGLALLVARSIARPLSRLERRAAEVSDGALDGAPLPLTGPREVAVVARTLNDAVANLLAIEQQAGALAAGDLAAASHALSPGKLSMLLHRSVEELARSIGDRERLRLRLQHDADHDALTGLANRRSAITQLDAMLAEPGPPVAVLFLDIDGLKRVNDEHGHAAGDTVLLATASRLLAAAPGGSLVARLGGDEFVLATRIGDASVAAGLASRIVQELGAPHPAGGLLVRAGASVGVAISTAGERADDILRWADVALYEAKRGGRGRAVLLCEEVRADVRDSQRLDDELRQAIDAGGLELHYQPIVEALSGDVHAVEALVRWRRSDGELIPPDRFIGVAERTGTIAQLDQWVLRAATRQVAAWRAGPFPGLRLAVNASARTLLSAQLAADVADALSDAGLPPEALELEVTETALLHDLDAAADNIAALHDLGVRTAIDDFGTGYTSVSQLRRLPVDQVKIDRSFVAGLDDDRDRVLVDLVIRIGHVLDIEVVAEGVETQTQLETLRALGCTLVQGYFLGRPLPPAELEASPSFAESAAVVSTIC